MHKSDYTQIFDQITPPPELVEQAKTVQAPARRRSRHMAGRMIAAAAAVCLLAGLGVSASMVKTVDPLSVRLESWGADELAVPVGVSDSSLGWTVTVDSVLGDSWYAYILCTLSRDDGKTIAPGEYGFQGWEFNYPEVTALTYGLHWFEDDDLTDNKVPFGFYLSNSSGDWDMTGYPLQMKLTGLITTSFAESWAMMVSNAEWELNFTLPEENAGTAFTPDLSVQLAGGEAVLEAVRVSPVELYAEFSSSEGQLLALSPFHEGFNPMTDNPIFVLTDGAELYVDGGGGGGAVCWYGNYRAPEGHTLTPADIAGLKIGDTLYPLDLT